MSYHYGMWQMFTGPARAAVFDAQKVAEELGQSYIAPEHFLLALVRMRDTNALTALIQMGFVVEDVEKEILKQFPSKKQKLEADRTLTPRSRQAIDFAYDEARKFGHCYIGTDHLLLGLLRERGNFAGGVLKNLGMDLHRCRDIVRGLSKENSVERESDDATYSFDQRYSRTARKVIRRAMFAASDEGQKLVDTEFLLMSIISEEDHSAAKVLAHLNVDVEQIKLRIVETSTASESATESQVRFSPATHSAIRLAIEEATLMGHDRAGTVHLLMGLVREEAGRAAQILRWCNLDTTKIREAFEAMNLDTSDENRGPYQEDLDEAKVRFAKITRVHLERQLSVQSDLLCIGLLREGATLHSALVDLSLDSETVALAVYSAVLASRRSQTAENSSITFADLLARAKTEAKELRQDFDEPHFLLAMLRNGDTALARALQANGITYENLRDWVALNLPSQGHIDERNPG